METILYVVFLLVLVFLIYYVWRARETLRDLRAENAGLLETVREYRRQLSIEAMHGQAAKLSRQLTTARAPVEAQIERYKHQNNEMRVAMSRINRHLSGLQAIFDRSDEKNARANPISKALDQAVAQWTACNNWLTANKVEPYLGDVPGYDGQNARAREDFVSRGNGEIQPSGVAPTL